MPTIPTHPVVMNQADIADTFQQWKDRGADMTALPVLVRETGELLSVEVLSDVTYVCGPEYPIGAQAIVAQPVTVDKNPVIVFGLPQDKSVLLSRIDLVSLCAGPSATDYWTFTLYAVDALLAPATLGTVNNSLATAATLYPQSITEFDVNPLTTGSLHCALMCTAHDETGGPGEFYLYALLHVRNIVATLT